LSKIYNYQWAWRVFNDFVNMYPRATEVFFRFHYITVADTVWYLQHNQLMWERFKKCVKILNNFPDIHFIDCESQETDKFEQFYLTYIKQQGLKFKKPPRKGVKTVDKVWW